MVEKKINGSDASLGTGWRICRFPFLALFPSLSPWEGKEEFGECGDDALLRESRAQPNLTSQFRHGELPLRSWECFLGPERAGMQVPVEQDGEPSMGIWTLEGLGGGNHLCLFNIHSYLRIRGSKMTLNVISFVLPPTPLFFLSPYDPVKLAGDREVCPKSFSLRSQNWDC